MLALQARQRGVAILLLTVSDWYEPAGWLLRLSREQAKKKNSACEQSYAAKQQDFLLKNIKKNSGRAGGRGCSVQSYDARRQERVG